MTDQTKDKDPYDFEKICTLCQCVEKTHIVFWNCPIMDNNPICSECCTISCLKNDIAERFSKTIGKELTSQQVNEACKNCSRNYACQNEELAKKLEQELQ